MAEVQIYTDGSSRGNPGKGGYGVVLVSGRHQKELSKGFIMTTNNRMELLSVIVGLEALRGEGHDVCVYSDSKYVVDSINKRWVFDWVKKDFKGKKNGDLWKKLVEILPKNKVRFEWVKGHNGHPMNERCDALAVAAALGEELDIDFGYERENK